MVRSAVVRYVLLFIAVFGGLAVRCAEGDCGLFAIYAHEPHRDFAACAELESAHHHRFESAESCPCAPELPTWEIARSQLVGLLPSTPNWTFGNPIPPTDGVRIASETAARDVAIRPALARGPPEV